jgi:hypothetical protein
MSKMKTKQIIQEVFNNMCKMYESIFTNYYPSHGSTGFTERNLTFYFSHFYLKSANNLSDIIVWQEVPIEEGGHFDTLIIDSINEKIIIIEAKRLQNYQKFESIQKDFDRIVDILITKNNDHGIKIPSTFSTYDKYALLLADIWLPKVNTIKEDIKKDFLENIIPKPIDNNCKVIENINIYEHSEEKYCLMYNLYKIS